MELLFINQVNHAIFNIRKRRTLTAVVDDAYIRLSIPRIIRKSQLPKYRIALLNFLVSVWDSHSGIIVHTYDHNQEEVFGIIACPEEPAFIGLSKEQVGKTYTTCSECGHQMDAPDNLKFTTIYNYIKED